MVNNFILKLKDQRKKDEEFFLIKTDNIIGEYYMKKMVEKKNGRKRRELNMNEQKSIRISGCTCNNNNKYWYCMNENSDHKVAYTVI